MLRPLRPSRRCRRWRRRGAGCSSRSVPDTKWPAKVRLFSAPLSVRRSVPAAFSMTWLRTRPPGSSTSTIGALRAWQRSSGRTAPRSASRRSSWSARRGRCASRPAGQASASVSRDELDVPDAAELGAVVEEIDQPAADAADGRDRAVRPRPPAARTSARRAPSRASTVAPRVGDLEADRIGRGAVRRRSSNGRGRSSRC